jgi:hypothetical protein
MKGDTLVNNDIAPAQFGLGTAARQPFKTAVCQFDH